MEKEKIKQLVEAWKKASEERPLIESSASALHQLRVNTIFVLILCKIANKMEKKI